MRLELHCHSTCSDGALEPEQLAQLMHEAEVELACLTDHDTMQGCERLASALAAAPQPAAGPVRVLRGLELSCKYERRTLHLLIWGVGEGAQCQALEQRLSEALARRRERIVAICERLASLGIALDPAPILAATRHRPPGRPDVARALVEAGHCKSMRAAFDKYLRDNGPADVRVDGIDIEEALELATGLGARVGLAHPHTLPNYAVVRELFMRYRDAGLEGIEAFYGHGSPAHAASWLRLAAELELVVTAGSDFHGGGAVTQITRPGITLPEPHAARLRDWFGGLPAIAIPAGGAAA